jgi:rubrerythrin
MLHHSEVLANLRQIKEMGMKKWTQREEDRWRCPQCKTFLSWYDPACPKCGAKRSERLFPLRKA